MEIIRVMPDWSAQSSQSRDWKEIEVSRVAVTSTVFSEKRGDPSREDEKGTPHLARWVTVQYRATRLKHWWNSGYYYVISAESGKIKDKKLRPEMADDGHYEVFWEPYYPEKGISAEEADGIIAALPAAEISRHAKAVADLMRDLEDDRIRSILEAAENRLWEKRRRRKEAKEAIKKAKEEALRLLQEGCMIYSYPSKDKLSGLLMDARMGEFVEFVEDSYDVARNTGIKTVLFKTDEDGALAVLDPEGKELVLERVPEPEPEPEPEPLREKETLGNSALADALKGLGL